MAAAVPVPRPRVRLSRPRSTAGIPGARVVLPTGPANDSAPPPATSLVLEGGSLQDLATALGQASVDDIGVRTQADMFDVAEAVEPGVKCGRPAPARVFYGSSVWAEGQLEGEIRARSWAFAPAEAADVFWDDPGAFASGEELWTALAASNDRLSWAHA